MRKLTQSFVEKQLEQRGYILKDNYKNNQIPMLCEYNGLQGYITYANFSLGKSIHFFKIDNNPFLEENIRIILKQKFPNIILNKIQIIKKKKRKRILMFLTCQCGENYKKIWNGKQGKYGQCLNCAKRNRQKKRKKGVDYVVQYIKQHGYKVLYKPQIGTINELVEVENQEGYRGFTSVQKLRQNKNMSIYDMRINHKYFLFNVNQYCKLNNIHSQALEFSQQDKWTRQGIKFQCECGNYFETSIASFQNGKIRCDECTKRKSKYENLVEEYLTQQNIEFISQFRINSCRDILPLPFDFWLKDYNTLIEVDGEGHFYPAHFNNIGYEDSQRTFEITQKHDRIKNEYCIKYNIPLIRITYKQVLSGEYKTIIDTLTTK